MARLDGNKEPWKSNGTGIPLDIPKKEEFIEILTCDRCGCAVINTELHDKFHAKLAATATESAVALLALNSNAPEWLR